MRERIVTLCEGFPRYDYQRVTHQLRAEGLSINPVGDCNHAATHVFVKTLFAQLAVETFDERILHRLAALDVVSPDEIGRPAEHRRSAANSHNCSRIIESSGPLGS